MFSKSFIQVIKLSPDMIRILSVVLSVCISYRQFIQSSNSYRSTLILTGTGHKSEHYTGQRKAFFEMYLIQIDESDLTQLYSFQ